MDFSEFWNVVLIGFSNILYFWVLPYKVLINLLLVQIKFNIWCRFSCQFFMLFTLVYMESIC